MKIIILLCAVAASVAAVSAKVVTKPVAYEHAGVKLEGYLAYDDEKVSAERLRRRAVHTRRRQEG